MPSDLKGHHGRPVKAVINSCIDCVPVCFSEWGVSTENRRFDGDFVETPLKARKRHLSVGRIEALRTNKRTVGKSTLQTDLPSPTKVAIAIAGEVLRIAVGENPRSYLN